jgi:hypothetical protein
MCPYFHAYRLFATSPSRTMPFSPGEVELSLESPTGIILEVLWPVVLEIFNRAQDVNLRMVL